MAPAMSSGKPALDGPAQPLFHYTAPVGIECCVCAPNATQAAKALHTTGNTLAARGKKYMSVSEALPGIRAGLVKASEQPGTIFIRQAGAADWEELSGDPGLILLTDRQRNLKTKSNAQIGEKPMKQRTLTCDDETWAAFLELGGSRWFRSAVRKAARAGKSKA